MKKSLFGLDWWQIVVVGIAGGIGQIFVHEVTRAFLPRYFSLAVVDWVDPMCRGFVMCLVVLFIIKNIVPPSK